jgi:hypothetical protein
VVTYSSSAVSAATSHLISPRAVVTSSHADRGQNDLKTMRARARRSQQGGSDGDITATPDVVDPTNVPCQLCCGRLHTAADIAVMYRGGHAFDVHSKCWDVRKSKYLAGLTRDENKAFVAQNLWCCPAKGCAMAVCTEHTIHAETYATSAPASAAPLSSEARAAEALLKFRGFNDARANEFGTKAAALAAKLRGPRDQGR